MKKIFIALVLFATMLPGTYAMPRKGNIDNRFGRMPLKELNLSDEQQSKIEVLNKDFRVKVKALRNDTTLTREAKAGQQKELNRSRNEAFRALLTPEQQTKWQEMQQRKSQSRRGKRMEFRNHMPMAKLNLTDEQKQKIQALNQEYREKQQELKKSKREQINSILTPEQQSILKEGRKHFAGKNKASK